MATRYNYTGKLITDGLVLNLDAAKRDSYPGSGTTWYDLSGNGNNGTLTNGPTYTGVSKDAAFVFDGVDDFVTMSLSVAQGQGDQTYSHWAKVNTTVSSDSFLFLEATAPNNNYTRLGCLLTTGNYVVVGGRGISNEPTGNGYFKTSSTKVVPNLWTNIVGMWDVTSSTIRIYINGSETSGSFSGAGSVQPHANTNPGTVVIGSSRNTEYFPGSIALSQVYNRILSPFEIFQNFNALKGRYGIPDIVTDGLVLNLDAGNPYSYLSGSSGTTWTDVSGQGNNGTLTNGASYANGAISFDGVDDKITFSSAPSFYTDYTIECFFKAISLNAGEGLVTWGENVNYKRRALILWNGGHSGYWTVRSSTFNSNPEGTTQIQTGTWYHAAVSLDASANCKIYVNGVLETTSTNTIATPGTNTLLLGDTGYPEPFNGHIASAKIYNRVLSDSEVLQNFNALRGRYGI